MAKLTKPEYFLEEKFLETFNNAKYVFDPYFKQSWMEAMKTTYEYQILLIETKLDEIGKQITPTVFEFYKIYITRILFY
jgi:hypothetical protein